MQAVWVDKKSEMNRTVGFLLKIAGAEKCVLRIAAGNVFKVFANGSFLNYGPQRLAHGHSNIMTFEIPASENGETVIAVEILESRCASYYTVNEPPFFAAELCCGGKVYTARDFDAFLLSDRVRKTQRYSPQRTFTEVYNGYNRSDFYKGNAAAYPKLAAFSVLGNVLHESAMPVPNVGRKYLPVKVLESGSVNINPALPIFHDRAIDEIGPRFDGYVKEDLEVRLSDEVCSFEYFKNQDSADSFYRLYEFSKNVTGFISLSVKVHAETEVYALFDEMLYHEALGNFDYALQYENNHTLPLVFHRVGSCNAVKWCLPKGEYKLQSFEPYTLKYLKIVALGGNVQIKGEPEIISYESACAGKLHFTASDSRAELLMKAAENNYVQNSADLLMDCPGRERGCYIGDSFFSAQGEYILTGENFAEKNMLKSFLLAPEFPKIPSEVLPMCYPADHKDDVFILTFHTFFLLQLKDSVKRHEDDYFAAAYKGKMYDFLNFIEKFIYPEGLIENPQGAIFVEYTDANAYVNGVSTVLNMLYYRYLTALSELYQDEAQMKKAERLKQKILQMCFDGTWFRDHLVRENGVLLLQPEISETCQYTAFFSGIAGDRSHPSLFYRLFEVNKPCLTGGIKGLCKSNVFTGYVMRFQYLMDTGRHQMALEECLDFFPFMAERTGTIWEFDTAEGSCCHGYGSFLAKIIVFALTGYEGFSAKKKEIYLQKRLDCPFDFNLTLPVGNSSVSFSGKENKMFVDEVPSHWHVVVF